MNNVVQIAIQNRIKLFYRPMAIKANYSDIWQEKLQISKLVGLKINNPTPYYITLAYLSQNEQGNFPGFDSVMIAPLVLSLLKRRVIAVAVITLVIWMILGHCDTHF